MQANFYRGKYSTRIFFITRLQYSWIGPPVCRRTRKINLPVNQKGYGKPETTYEKLSARRIQICRVYFCVIHFRLFFKITFKIMLKQKYTQQIWIRLVKYSCAEVSGSSEVPQFVGNLIFSYLRKPS